MKCNIKKICGYAVVLAATVFTVTAFAAEDTADYGFRKGKAAHYGTGGEQTFVYSEKSHNDTESLVESGIIDQETADKISEYMSKKHEEISRIYDGMSDMSPTERHTAFAERKSSRGNGLEELVDAGIITQEQADMIKAADTNR